MVIWILAAGNQDLLKKYGAGRAFSHLSTLSHRGRAIHRLDKCVELSYNTREKKMVIINDNNVFCRTWMKDWRQEANNNSAVKKGREHSCRPGGSVSPLFLRRLTRAACEGHVNNTQVATLQGFPSDFIQMKSGVISHIVRNRMPLSEPSAG